MAGIRTEYEAHGVEEFYSREGGSYRNPHEAVIRVILGTIVSDWSLDLGSVLDLACGSGEVTLALRGLGARRIDGIDPYTGEAYHTRTGSNAESFRFEEIAGGALTGRRYSLIVCSFALHLADESWLPTLLYRLAEISDTLVILTPHKRPVIRGEWGWVLRDEKLVDRVRCRCYQTNRSGTLTSMEEGI